MTPENKVATAERLSKLEAACFWENWMIGTPAAKSIIAFGEEDEGYDVPICMKIESVEVTSSIYSPISIEISWR